MNFVEFKLLTTTHKKMKYYFQITILYQELNY